MVQTSRIVFIIIMDTGFSDAFNNSTGNGDSEYAFFKTQKGTSWNENGTKVSISSCNYLSNIISPVNYMCLWNVYLPRKPIHSFDIDGVLLSPHNNGIDIARPNCNDISQKEFCNARWNS